MAGIRAIFIASVRWSRARDNRGARNALPQAQEQPAANWKARCGKTALVIAVASRLYGNVPQRLRKRILEVSRLRLLADAKFAGETEER